jgi:hypothetical protein
LVERGLGKFLFRAMDRWQRAGRDATNAPGRAPSCSFDCPTGALCGANDGLRAVHAAMNWRPYNDDLMMRIYAAVAQV